MIARLNTIIILLFVSAFAFACSHSPKYKSTTLKNSTKVSIKEHQGEKIAHVAKSLLGSPYKYGGASPKGFDCSGLVYYTHGKVGIRTPRTSLQQYKRAKIVELKRLNNGDLVFFTLNKNKISHVGIYIGKGQFIHAPNNGKHVAINHLSEDFWKTRIVSAGRFY
jgi:cell wall-associated NlpC family hydrolase